MRLKRAHQLLAAFIFRNFAHRLLNYDLIELDKIFTGKLSAQCLGIEFAWIQNIKIQPQSNLAEVGHFGVTTEMLGLGIGKALFEAFIKQLKSSYNCSKVVFIEFIPGSDRGQFLQKLGAIPRRQPNSKGYDTFDLNL